MHRDAIVEEVRKYREQNAARFGFDVRKIAEDAIKRQATSGHRVVDFSQTGEGTSPVRKAKRVLKKVRGAGRTAAG